MAQPVTYSPVQLSSSQPKRINQELLRKVANDLIKPDSKGFTVKPNPQGERFSFFKTLTSHYIIYDIDVNGISRTYTFNDQGILIKPTEENRLHEQDKNKPAPKEDFAKLNRWLQHVKQSDIELIHPKENNDPK